jgi:hypothetical protein
MFKYLFHEAAAAAAAECQQTCRVVSCRVTLTFVYIPSETGINVCEKKKKKTFRFPFSCYSRC